MEVTDKHKIGPDGLIQDGVTSHELSTADFELERIANESLSSLHVPRIFDRSAPKSRLFVATFDGTGNDAITDPEHRTNPHRIHVQAKQAANADRRIAAEYMVGPGTQSSLVPRVIDGALGYSYDQRIEEMYLLFIAHAEDVERLPTQMWDWKQSDPETDVVLVTLMKGAGTLQAIDFLEIAREFQIVDRASIRGTDKSTEGARID